MQCICKDESIEIGFWCRHRFETNSYRRIGQNDSLPWTSFWATSCVLNKADNLRISSWNTLSCIGKSYLSAIFRVLVLGTTLVPRVQRSFVNSTFYHLDLCKRRTGAMSFLFCELRDCHFTFTALKGLVLRLSALYVSNERIKLPHYTVLVECGG